MTRDIRQGAQAPTFSLRIGRTLEAHATGWGVLALAFVAAVFLAAGVVSLALG